MQLFTIPGFSSPAPLGGVQRAVMVNLDPTQLYANGLSPVDIGNALATTNVVIPSGTAKMGNYEYNVDLNMSPTKVSEFNQLPIKYVNGAPVFLGDVAPVTDTHQPQTNVVRIDGQSGDLPAGDQARRRLDADRRRCGQGASMPDIRAIAPKGLKVTLTFDQSQFVRAALWDVVREAVIAAGLVALMVLMFLGSPRSMLIVITSIPLSILTAIIGLKLTGQTINTMTLGGIALAVGMLVDDATVEIENIHRNHAMHKPLLVAILDGAIADRDADLRRHALHLHRVFPGRAADRRRALSVHAARARGRVRDADLVPAVAHAGADDGALPAARRARGRSWATAAGPRFVRGFEARLRAHARSAIASALGNVHRASRPLADLRRAADRRHRCRCCWSSARISFRRSTPGMMKLHVRAPTGTRIEQTEYMVDDIERSIRTIIPADELEQISDNIGLPHLVRPRLLSRPTASVRRTPTF